MAPQYILEWDHTRREGGTVPDFVALDFSALDAKEVVVVEVTTRATWRPLMAKVKQRHRHWYAPICRQLFDCGAISPNRAIRVLGFGRQHIFQKAKPGFDIDEDVTIAVIEQCVHPWEYWTERESVSLPGKGRSIPVSSVLLPDH